MRKTYAARGLLDWQMALNVGGAILKICFSGGSMGSNGVVPARYVTDNEAIQHLIEKTPQFKKGKIILLDCHPLTKENDPEIEKPEIKNDQRDKTSGPLRK